MGQINTVETARHNKAGGSTLASDFSRTAMAAAGASSVEMAVSTADFLPVFTMRAVRGLLRLGFGTLFPAVVLVFGFLIVARIFDARAYRGARQNLAPQRSVHDRAAVRGGTQKDRSSGPTF